MTTKLKENHGVNEPCKRNFLKENMENITKLKKQKQNKENERSNNRNGIRRVQAGGKPRFLWRKRDFSEVQCQCDPFYLADHDTQTYRTEDETFMEGAKVIFPSTEILKAIREERERKFQENLSEKLREKRKFDRTDDEIYLDSLTEYIDTGAISRRKKLMAEETLEMDKKLTYLENDTKMAFEQAKKRIKISKEPVNEIPIHDETIAAGTSADAMSQGEEVDSKEALMGKNIENAIKNNKLIDDSNTDNINTVDTVAKGSKTADTVEEKQGTPEKKGEEIVVLFKRSAN